MFEVKKKVVDCKKDENGMQPHAHKIEKKTFFTGTETRNIEMCFPRLPRKDILNMAIL